MFWLVTGYLFLFIFRPYEYWPILGEFRVERIYMLILIFAVATGKGKRYIPHSVTRTVLLFFGALVLSGIAALNFDDAYNRIFDYFKIIVFYFILILTIRDERDLRNFLIAYIAIMFIYLSKSSWEFFVHDRHFYRMGIKRMLGIDNTYGDPNAFAASIIYSLPFLWAMMRAQFEGKWIKRLLWAYGLLSIVCVIYTGSRSAMVTALLFFFMVGLGTSRKFLSVIGMVFLVLTIWMFMPEKYQARFMSSFESGINQSADESAAGRTYTLKRGVDMFKEFPVLGVGPGNFPKGLELFDDYSGLNAHNLYGLLLGETGFIGASAFLLMVLMIIRTHRKVIRKAKEFNNNFLRLIGVASIQAVVLLLFNGNFGGNLYRYNWLWIGAIGVLATHFLRSREAGEAIKEAAGDKLKYRA